MQYPQLLPDTQQSINALKATTAIVSTIYEEFGLTPGESRSGTVVQPARPVRVSLHPERMTPLLAESCNGVFVRADEHHLYLNLYPAKVDFASVEGEIRIWTHVIDELFMDRRRMEHVEDYQGVRFRAQQERDQKWRAAYKVYHQNMEALLMRLYTTKRRAQILEIVREMVRHYVWMIEQEQALTS